MKIRTTLVLAAFIALAVPVHADGGGEPRLVCDEPAYNFGTVQNRDSIEHTFLLRNEGDSDLVIKRVHTSCGCTTTKLIQNNIPPGGEAELVARFSLKGRRGKQHKNIYVHSNDPNSPRYRLELAGEILNDIEVRPNTIFFGHVTDDSVVEKTVHILSNTDKPFHITGIETNDALFCTMTVKPIEDGHKYDLNFKLMLDNLRSTGVLKGKTVVCTDYPAYARIEIPVTVYIMEPVTITPRKLVVWKSGENGKSLTRYLVVRSFKDKPIKILGIETPASEIDVKIETLGIGRHRIRISNFRPSKDLDGKIFRVRVKKPDGEEEILEVPLQVKEKGG